MSTDATAMLLPALATRCRPTDAVANLLPAS
jgi:hypothetical protein